MPGVQFKIDGVNTCAEDTSAPYTYSLNTTLFSNASHNITAVARDAAGNSSTSAAVTVTVDNLAPVISAVSASGITSGAASISWTTDELSDSQIDYGLTTAYGSSTALDTSLLTAHARSLSSLSPGMTYHYRVKSRAAAGNSKTSSVINVTVFNDTAAPYPPGRI